VAVLQTGAAGPPLRDDSAHFWIENSLSMSRPSLIKIRRAVSLPPSYRWHRKPTRARPRIDPDVHILEMDLLVRLVVLIGGIIDG
jgi:hypothetical protein